MRRSSSSLITVPRRWFTARYQTPRRTAPAEAPPVVFKPARVSFTSLKGDRPEPSVDPNEALQTYWPDNFVPNLVKPLPWIADPAPVTTPVDWTSTSVRSGVLGRKLGMMAVWDKHGVRHPLTVIEVDSQVVRINNEVIKGKVGVVMGMGRKKLKKVTKAEMVQAKKAGVHPHANQAEFRVTPDAVLPLTHSLTARHFLPGQYLDVCGTSTGWGFQGAMQRWNFSGQPASHGVSLTHRSHGATGSRQDPGRVFKNKKMAGRMGGTRVTQMNLQLYQIDPVRNLLFVKGAIPGRTGAVLRVRDAIKKPHKVENPPPFPTFIGDTGSEIVTMPAGETDPFAYGGT